MASNPRGIYPKTLKETQSRPYTNDETCNWFISEAIVLDFDSGVKIFRKPTKDGYDGGRMKDGERKQCLMSLFGYQ